MLLSSANTVMYVKSIQNTKSVRSCINRIQSRMNIILIGPPGSGKSTQGSLLGDRLNIPYISAGKMLRSISEGTSKDAEMIREYVNNGNLLPDDVMLPLIQSFLKDAKFDNGFVLDGFPRTLNQALGFETQIDKVVYVRLTDEEAMNRIRTRTEKRNDQSEETVRHRLTIFHTETDEVIKHYRGLGKLIEVDGMPAIEDIHIEILEKLGIN